MTHRLRRRIYHKHIAGHRVLIHRTVTSQMMERDGYLEAFARFWSERPEVKEVQFTLFTPQVGEKSPEILSPEAGRKAVSELDRLHRLFPGMRLNGRMLAAFMNPPDQPNDCAFARLTSTVRRVRAAWVSAPSDFGPAHEQASARP